MDLPLSKNDITNNLWPQKPVVYSSDRQSRTLADLLEVSGIQSRCASVQLCKCNGNDKGWIIINSHIFFLLLCARCSMNMVYQKHEGGEPTTSTSPSCTYLP